MPPISESAPDARPADGSVVVVTGAGGMGVAASRRIGRDRTVVLADVGERQVRAAADELTADGLDVVPLVVDVSDRSSVEDLARRAAERGPVTAVVHTAGLSPVQASVERIMHVDLLGTALVVEAFGAVVADGGAGVFISSMAGTMADLDPDLQARLATTPPDQLLDLPELAVGDTGTAYCIAKRGNQVRVQAAAGAWGARGATVNSISPGVISTPMGRAELDSEHGGSMRMLLDGSAAGRPGTAEEIAGAVAFLTGPDARYVTGTDLLVDGGVIAWLRSTPPTPT